jgi:hypothetical protein
MNLIENNLINENKNLWKKIPLDVFINHIIPYTYKKINNSLLNDIRNFIRDYKTIRNYYFYDLNEYCLLNDLVSFCNNNTPLSHRVSGSFLYILNRSIMFNKLSWYKKVKYIEDNFIYNSTIKTQSKIKNLFSLLRPSERAQFINKYIIEYFE